MPQLVIITKYFTENMKNNVKKEQNNFHICQALKSLIIMKICFIFININEFICRLPVINRLCMKWIMYRYCK